MKKKRILFAAIDIGYRIEHYTKFIDKYLSDKLVAESFSKYVLPESHYKTKYTYSCPIDKTHPLILYLYSFSFFLFSLFRYDIFHFISGETILTRKLRSFELKIYKLLGKRVVMHFVGSDIRSEEYLYWKERNIKQYLNGTADFPISEPWQDKLIFDAEKYADCILVSTPDLKSIIPKSIYYPVLLDLEIFFKEISSLKPNQKQKDEIVILHSPSNTLLKGTIYIHEILKKVAKNSKYKIRLVLPGEKLIGTDKKYSVTRYQLFKLYQEADIVIDQLIIGWYGLQSVEALALKKNVICFIDDSLKDNVFTNCPIEVADVNTLEIVITDCIERIIMNQKKDLTENVTWVQKHHTIENNNLTLLKAWGQIEKTINK